MSGATAKEKAFKALDGGITQVLHLATHSFFLPVKRNKPNDNENGGFFAVQQNPLFRSGLGLYGGNRA